MPILPQILAPLSSAYPPNPKLDVNMEKRCPGPNLFLKPLFSASFKSWLSWRVRPASYLWGSVPSYVVPYISVSYFSTSYFWFFLSLRFPILNLRFLMSVYPMFGVSYFCVPIFMSSHLHVTLKMGWHRKGGPPPPPSRTISVTGVFETSPKGTKTFWVPINFSGSLFSV